MPVCPLCDETTAIVILGPVGGRGPYVQYACRTCMCRWWGWGPMRRDSLDTPKIAGPISADEIIDLHLAPKEKFEEAFMSWLRAS